MTSSAEAQAYLRCNDLYELETSQPEGGSTQITLFGLNFSSKFKKNLFCFYSYLRINPNYCPILPQCMICTNMNLNKKQIGISKKII